MELLLFEMLMMKFRLFQSVDGNLVLVTGNTNEVPVVLAVPEKMTMSG